MNPNDGLPKQFIDATIALLTQKGDLLVPVGFKMLSAIAVILVIWHGFQMAQGASGHGLVNALVHVAVCFSLLTFYGQPFPGTNENFHQVFTDTGSWLAQQVDNGIEAQLGEGMTKYEVSMDQPIGTEILNIAHDIQFFIATLAIAVAQFIMVAVLGIGPLVCAMLIVAGPVIIPLSLVPWFSFLSTGWLRSLVQFSLYPFFGNIFIWVFAQMWFGFFSQPTANNGVTGFMAILIQEVVLAGVFFWSMKQLPSIIAGICSGGGNHGWMPSIGIWR